MPKFRKKPVVVEAIQWTGSNLEEIRNFVGSDLIEDYMEFFDIKRTLKKMLVDIATVSYTHLDVYKRQAVMGTPAITFPNIGIFMPCLILESEIKSSILIPK